MSMAKEQIRQIISENNITSVTDVYALLKDSFKDILQELMEAELDATLGYEKNRKGDLQTDNKRNGHSTKTLKSQYGEFQIDVPRDRNGEFEPKLIPKYQRNISGIEEKVISLYARGMSTRDIHDQLNDLYGIELSAEMVSKITDKILPQVKEWQSRPLDPAYPFVFMDCIHYKVREDGRILSRAAYVVLGVTVEEINAYYAQMQGVETGVRVAEVVRGGAADLAEIQVGDYIVAFNGDSVSTISELNYAKDKCKVGDTVKVELRRQGQKVTVDLVLKDANQLAS